jgi:AmpD protein
MSLSETSLFFVDDAGWCAGVDHKPSPNCDPRPEGAEAELLVIHSISLPPSEYGGQYIADLFTNRLDCDAHPYFDRLRNLKVSAHFVIRRDGQIIQFVPIFMRAWHAGASNFCGRERCNDFSIGIELEGSDFEPFTASQYRQLALLTCSLQQALSLRHVTGHEHIAPGRKTDPGPCFDWAGYRQDCESLHAVLFSASKPLLQFSFAS